MLRFMVVFIEFVTVLFLFYLLWVFFVCFFFFWPQSMWDLPSQAGVEPTPPALEGKVLTTGWPGKSLLWPLVGFP